MSATIPKALRAPFHKVIEEEVVQSSPTALRLKLSPVIGAWWGLSTRRSGQRLRHKVGLTATANQLRSE